MASFASQTARFPAGLNTERGPAAARGDWPIMSSYFLVRPVRLSASFFLLLLVIGSAQVLL